MMKNACFLLSVALFCFPVLSQTKADYGETQAGDSSKLFGFIDPARLSVSHSMSFGMLSGGSSSIQSQSFYSTMLQYRFAAPVTLNLNFGLPIHSTFSPHQNLTGENMQSLNYFKNIPFDVSFTWKPSERFFFNLSVVNYPSYYGHGYGMFDRGLMMQSKK
ncbi:MAG: hypothetical protein JW699_02665 [Chitinispirillaceae bacterium]|nr:hypothetical protein [Chitinispirillaceae bacterium]